MGQARLERITIRGFRSIERLDDFELGPLTVLIGANGAGKSNFVEVFRFMRALVLGRLQQYSVENGPPDALFWKGSKPADAIELVLSVLGSRYSVTIGPTAEGSVLVKSEWLAFNDGGAAKLPPSAREAGIATVNDRLPLTDDNVALILWHTVSNWHVYHVHDSSTFAAVRRAVGVGQSELLWSDASNLAAVLRHWRDRDRDRYATLRGLIQRVAPFFDDFVLTPEEGKDEPFVRLTWRQRGTDYIFQPAHLSDGTLRFICLATALLQPTLPNTVVIDEPELGLHPQAIAVLAGLIRSASAHTQIIVTTQSTDLLSEFEANQVTVVEYERGRTTLKRLNEAELADWLSEYSLGDLWRKGILGGSVNHG